MKNKNRPQRLPEDFNQLSRKERAADVRERLAAHGGAYIRRDGSFRAPSSRGTREHWNNDAIEARRKAVKRGLGRAAAVSVAAVGLGAAVGAASAEDPNPYLVDRAKIATLTPDQITAGYDTVSVDPGDNLEALADEYIGSHGGSRREVLESLTVQARQIDETAGRPMNEHIIQPGETYYLPHNG